jgi:hypothetical protein
VVADMGSDVSFFSTCFFSSVIYLAIVLPATLKSKYILLI